LDIDLPDGLKVVKVSKKLILPNLLVTKIMPIKKAVSITVQGKVQGVGFRYFVKSNAKRLNLVGFVKNQKDGSLYGEIIGNEDNIKKLIALCYKGPLLSQIVEVKVKDIKLFEATQFVILK